MATTKGPLGSLGRGGSHRLWFAAAVLYTSQLGLQCPPPEDEKKFAVTKCASDMFACFDELARQPGNIVAFRPTSRWNKTHLKWSLAPHPNLNTAEQDILFQNIFIMWSAASSLTFERVANPNAADIKISFESGAHGDESDFDGPGRQLGHAYFPGSSRPGLVHLCREEDWTLGAHVGQFDLFTVAAHEIGHALGLEHSLASPSLMSYGYEGPVPMLASNDVKSIRMLYGTADGQVPPIQVFQPGQFSVPAPNLTALMDPDTDGDGIPDSVEVFILGTDPNSPDDDSDGMNDFDEIFVFGTSPVPVGFDSDNDGLPDASPNGFDERNFGTNPFVPDTDGDGLIDGFEVFYLGTNPLSFDTDGDGFDDFNDPFPTFSNFFVLDLCAAGFFDPDCNFNGFQDNCDIVVFRISPDENQNGVPDECEGDFDGDGVPDFADGCPGNPFKTAPGACGCAFLDFDTDGDTFPDCFDECPTDPFKVFEGCGCFQPDTDFNGNGMLDCFE